MISSMESIPLAGAESYCDPNFLACEEATNLFEIRRRSAHGSDTELLLIMPSRAMKPTTAILERPIHTRGVNISRFPGFPNCSR